MKLEMLLVELFPELIKSTNSPVFLFWKGWITIYISYPEKKKYYPFSILESALFTLVDKGVVVFGVTQESIGIMSP